MVAMSQLIDAAVATKPDGLVVSIPDANALGPAHQDGHRRRHPGDLDQLRQRCRQESGHSDPRRPDRVSKLAWAAATQMAAAGVKHALCVNQEVGNAALDLRCNGFNDAMTKAGAQSRRAGGRPNEPDRLAAAHPGRR